MAQAGVVMSRSRVGFLNYRISDFCLPFMLLFLTVAPTLQAKVSSSFSAADELCEVAVIAVAGFQILFAGRKGLKALNRSDSLIFCLFIVLTIIGFLGDYASSFQPVLNSVLGDCLNCAKFFLVYLAASKVFTNAHNSLKICMSFARILLPVLACLGLAGLVVNTGFTDASTRFGLHVFCMGTHPGILVGVVIPWLSILLVKPEENYFYIFCGLLVCGLTFRSKAFGYIGLVILILVLLRRRDAKLGLGFIALAVGAVCLIGMSQFSYYYLDETASRAMCLKASVNIANDFFPIGSGFGTFGTNWSTYPTYSNAYYAYGLSMRWGFLPTPEGSAFVGDGGWSTCIAQFGWLGLLILLLMFGLIAVKASKTAISSKLVGYAPYISILGFMLISSMSDAIFFSSTAVGLAITLGALFCLSSPGAEEAEVER